ncbi:hypothetical protein ABZX95_06255 [Streptomyces sp. NPDC004232]|uniref:hypothetical protein n=1 Tax=Streptomyces sp. NPDC004232 TaxID=3154454 RepID=UPI0033BD2AAE
MGTPENPAFIGVKVERAVRDAIDARARSEQSSRSVVTRRILTAWWASERARGVDASENEAAK